MTENLNFGQAIEAMKQGKRVARTGWNGKGMFVYLLPASNMPVSSITDETPKQMIEEKIFNDTVDFLPAIRMFTADKKILTGWLASQTDMLSEDWYILN
jgi:hypothetical protein